MNVANISSLKGKYNLFSDSLTQSLKIELVFTRFPHLELFWEFFNLSVQYVCLKHFKTVCQTWADVLFKA